MSHPTSHLVTCHPELQIIFRWKEGGHLVLMLSSTSRPHKKGRPGKSLKNTIRPFCPSPPHRRPRKSLQSEKIFFLSRPLHHHCTLTVITFFLHAHSCL